jgi:hypothetical protein
MVNSCAIESPDQLLHLINFSQATNFNENFKEFTFLCLERSPSHPQISLRLQGRFVHQASRTRSHPLKLLLQPHSLTGLVFPKAS